MFEVTSADFCYSPAEYFALSNQIQQSHIQFGIICLVIGYTIAKIMPIVRIKIKEWKNGRAPK